MKTKVNLSPRTATTDNEICRLKRDNIFTREWWILISPQEVHITRQRSGESATEKISIPRKTFEKFIDWYNKKQS